MKAILAFLLIALVVVSALTASSYAATNTNGPVSVSGPSSVAVSSKFVYSVSVQDIFNNYSISMVVSGYNLTDASPIDPTYITDLRSLTPTDFNVTAPNVTTTMFLLFQVKGNLDGASYYYNVTSVVQVKQFTTLKTVIKNPSKFSMSDINVTFKVNGKYVGSEIVNISENSTKNVTYQWVSGVLPSGVYAVTVLTNNSLVQLQNGNSYTFQIQSGNPFVVYIYLGIVAFLGIVVVVLFIASYYARKRRPKWKK
ncbi:MAG: hypothetical protein M1290_06760 [Candidatus Thermoplasmatota archaeon]|jgi:hypothetical protein|nr:hypothetical protein [Candidatus Thermoplasmatota archaeon]MCL5790143.1 hypothetical protein [Candidatus Thermoplasmatota archaeon]